MPKPMKIIKASPVGLGSALPNGSVFSTATFRVVVQTIYSTLSFGNVQIVLVAHCGVSLPCLFTRGGEILNDKQDIEPRMLVGRSQDWI